MRKNPGPSGLKKLFTLARAHFMDQQADMYALAQIFRKDIWPMEDTPDEIAGYRIDRVLGAGGMGVGR